MQTVQEHITDMQGKKVIIRCNFDVPMENGKVVDTTRIETTRATLELLLAHKCQVLMIAHYDRPDGSYDSNKSLQPVVEELEKLLTRPIQFLSYQSDIKACLDSWNKPIALLDNLRFWPEETSNSPSFAQAIAQAGDVYINEAFANCHRKHASIVGIPQHLESYAGLLLAEEVDVLQQVRQHPATPLVIVIGGAKLETKEPLITAFADTASHILVGGKLALDLQQHPQPLPDNVIVADLIDSGRDITSSSAHEFARIIAQAKSVIWNGTMGVVEEPEHQQGSKIVAEAIQQSPAFTVIGGGDTESAITLFDTESGIDHISTGGGAMLTLLSTGSLPGIEVL